MNEDLKEKCPVLKQYTQYVEQVRRNSASMPLEQAVEAAIEYCIRQDILKDFLLKQRAEVVKMSIFEYDEEREMELIRRDEREIGEQIGAEKERKKAEQELKPGECCSVNDFSLPETGRNKRTGNRRTTGKLWTD